MVKYNRLFRVGFVFMYTNIKIEDMPVYERPFEKYGRIGIEALSDTELLALILRNGTKNTGCLGLCREVLKLGGDSLTGLYGLSDKELCKISGIGPVKAVKLQAVCELARRMAKTKRPHDEPLDSAKKISERYMEDMRHLKEEHVLLILLDTKFRPIKEITVGIGSVDRTVLRPREIFIRALKYDAVNIILLHNHPSGDPSPSRADIAVTEKIIKASSIVGIPLADHIIIGDCSYVSMRENDIVNFEP